MKVLYLTDSLSDLDGVGRYGLSLIAACERLEPDLQVEVLLARKHRPTSAEVPGHWKVEVALPPDYFFYMSPARFWPSLVTSTWRAARAARGCDLVHAIKDYPHSLVALRAARRAGKPCVATAHGTYSVLPLLQGRHQERARETYAAFDAMIAVSQYTRRRLLEAMPAGSLDPARFGVVPNAVDAERFEVPALEGARAWHGKRYTLAMGETKPRKGHHLSLGAFARLASDHPDLHHFLVGRLSQDEYSRGLERVVAEAGLTERVHFLGNVSEAEKVDLLQRAEVFVHTPVTAEDGGFEGFGIVYLEASASATACLGTLESGAEDAVLDGETGLLVEQDEASVEQGLRRLLADADLRARMGVAGRAHARRQTWEANAQAVLQVYRRALGGSA